MKQGTVIGIPRSGCRLRFDGYQRQLFGPDQSAWTVLHRDRQIAGRRVYTRKGAKPTEIEWAVALALASAKRPALCA